MKRVGQPLAGGARIAGRKIGIEVGDTIKRINDKEVSTLEDVVEAIKHADRVKLEILRKRKPLTLEENADL